MASETAQDVQEILEEIASLLAISAELEIVETPEAITATFIGEDASTLIGHHGATLDALQHLVHRMVFQGRPGQQRIVVDAAGYRERRSAKLESIADQVAARALKNGTPVKMEAMNSQERKVVHEYLKLRGDVETFSEGQEPNRRLVVAPLADAAEGVVPED